MGNLLKLPEGTELQVGSHKVTIVKYLSEGGFAHIYEVTIDPKEKDSEIACLKRVLVPDKNGLNQLRKEVDVMKTLRYGRNIVKYYDSHAERLEDGTYQVLVLMELCPNKSLLDYMNAKIKTKLTEEEILKIMLDISVGVYEMHKLKMIHRDIKIENVLIDAKHDFKLCDFGSTSMPIMPPRDQQQFQHLSHDIMYQTTPQYRAPEMIDLYRGYPIDEKADIWALGCFLYKLCYYTTPFEANGDIAILHATFQFLPKPDFSGDLKNLIIIMLQENPLLRPNIVQVLMLLCQILKVDFKDIDIEDIYATGPYNFHALHEYQRQKQAEILKQQQLYYQQQAFNNESKSSSEVNLTAIQHDHKLRLQTQSPYIQEPTAPPSIAQAQVQQPPMQSQQHQRSQQHTDAQVQSQMHTLVPQQNEQESLADKNETQVMNAEGDDSLDDFEIENLDDVEERYPSLDDLLEAKGSKLSNSDNRKENQKDKEMSPVYQNNKNQGPPQYTQIPIQPLILNNNDLQKLTPEQIQQYHYQHQAYQYQLSKYQKEYYQLQQQHPSSPSQTQHQQSHHKATILNNSNVDQQQLAKTQNEPSEFEKKEAWEKQHSTIEKDAEKLADDIFASGTKSPVVSPTMKTQKTNQSTNSEIEPYHSLSKSISAVSATHSEDRSKDVEGENFGSSEAHIETTEPLYEAEVKEDKIDNVTAKNDMSNNKENYESFNVNDADNNGDIAPGYQIPQGSPTHRETNYQLQLPSNEGNTMIGSNIAGDKNPFPYDQQQRVEYPKPTPEMTIPSSGEPKKNVNPWGNYTKSGNIIPMRKVSSHSGLINLVPIPNLGSPGVPINEQIGSLSLNDEGISQPKRGKNEKSTDSNLIDLEVGLESLNSSTGTPVNSNAQELYGMNTEASLLDLDIDEEKRSGEAKPQFKKRVSSIQNPSNFVVQEEVIDFASDDENPENSSQMNRLSIRNSLSRKPKSRKTSEHRRSGEHKRPGEHRKSNEHKRSDSSNSEGKKRHSLFGNATNN